MTPETVLNDAMNAIETAKKAGRISGFLTFTENELKVVPILPIPLRSLTFFKLTEKHIQEGLTLQEWDTLKLRLWHFFEERN